MYMISRPSREPGIDPRIPIVLGPIPAGGVSGSQKFTVAHRWRDLSTVSPAPDVATGSAEAASSNPTTIPVRDDTSAA